jgi:hypothetical protein
MKNHAKLWVRFFRKTDWLKMMWPSASSRAFSAPTSNPDFAVWNGNSQ